MAQTATSRRNAIIGASGAVAAIAIAAAAGLAFTQEPVPGQRGRRPGFPSPIFNALDANRDGTLSSAEIANAPATLRTVDRSGDGALSAEEFRPAFRGGRGERGRGRGDEPGQTPPAGADDLAAMLMAFDKNGDGQLTSAEVPERMQGLFDRADRDKDGALSADELKQSAAAQSRQTAGIDSREAIAAGGKAKGVALDTNTDGAIAADEIAGAAGSLATLDRNGDGRLTIDEIAPAFGRGDGGRSPQYRRPESR